MGKLPKCGHSLTYSTLREESIDESETKTIVLCTSLLKFVSHLISFSFLDFPKMYLYEKVVVYTNGAKMDPVSYQGHFNALSSDVCCKSRDSL